MIELEKFPFQKAIHLLTKILPGFAVLYVYNSREPGTLISILSLPSLGYATRVWLLVVVCFSLGYTLSTFINTAVGAAGGAIGALWASFTQNRHPYKYQSAPWRDPNWRAAYICRFGSESPRNLTLVLPTNAAELLGSGELLLPNMAAQQKLAEQITLQINAGLRTAIDAVTNDTEWRMCFERMKFKVLFESPLEPIEEIFGRLNSDFALTSAVLIVGTALSAQCRVWWLVTPATGWIIVSLLRFCAKAYQIAEPWSTLRTQIETLKSGTK